MARTGVAAWVGSMHLAARTAPNSPRSPAASRAELRRSSKPGGAGSLVWAALGGKLTLSANRAAPCTALAAEAVALRQRATILSRKPASPTHRLLPHLAEASAGALRHGVGRQRIELDADGQGHAVAEGNGLVLPERGEELEQAGARIGDGRFDGRARAYRRPVSGDRQGAG